MKIVISLLFLVFSSISKAQVEKYQCIKSAKKYEKIFKLPENLLVSIALTESGKKIKNGEFVAWPWTINMRGKGRFFKSKEAALTYADKFIKKGKKNIDMGCMQVNYMYHPKAFNNLEKAFDPEANVRWSANLIKNLYQKYGSYKDAVGYYHSYRTVNKNKYSSKVFKTWRNLNKNDTFAYLNTDIEKPLKKNIILKNNVNYKGNNKNNNLDTSKSSSHKSFKQINKPNKKVNSSYIIARMEKVKFFRNYFLKTN